MKKIKGGVYSSFPNQPMGYPQSRWESFQNYGYQGIQKINNNRKTTAFVLFLVILIIIGIVLAITKPWKKLTYECNQETYKCEKFEKKEDIDKEKGDYEDEESCEKKCKKK